MSLLSSSHPSVFPSPHAPFLSGKLFLIMVKSPYQNVNNSELPSKNLHHYKLGAFLQLFIHWRGVPFPVHVINQCRTRYIPCQPTDAAYHCSSDEYDCPHFFHAPFSVGAHPAASHLAYFMPHFVSFSDTFWPKKILSTLSASNKYFFLILAISPCVNSAPFSLIFAENVLLAIPKNSDNVVPVSPLAFITDSKRFLFTFITSFLCVFFRHPDCNSVSFYCQQLFFDFQDTFFDFPCNISYFVVKLRHISHGGKHV